jgi:DNA methyltransferase 1-associated protein 1
MLDLPSAAASRPTKKSKPSVPRQNLKGLQREVQSLGGDNPIAIVPAVPLFKKRRLGSRKPAARWELKPFKNSARTDDLVLRHWRRAADGPTSNPAGENDDDSNSKGNDIEDSMFAKYNVQVNIPTYDNEQYEARLKSDNWTKEETDCLMGLVREFDLRWPVIWDRYEYTPALLAGTEGRDNSTALVAEVKPRTVEELKARYYEVAAKMMAVNHPVHMMSQTEFSLYQLMSSFNPAQEALRKRFAEAAMARSPEERREEESLLVELKRIMQRYEKLNEERRELYLRLDTPPAQAGSNLGIYSTSHGLQQLVQQLMNADKNKKRKSILGPEGTPTAATPTASTAPQDSRRESTVAAPTPTTAAGKKGASSAPAGPQERRRLSPEEETIFGVSHHERLTGGPSFRHDKVTKLISARSAQLAAKITNILTELEIPPRLIMPTREVTEAYEGLMGDVNKLLEARKLSDKLDGEIKLAEAAKAEREKKLKEADEKPEGEAVKAEGDNEEAAVAESGKAVHKRSASVLSQVSDKSSKRQKK